MQMKIKSIFALIFLLLTLIGKAQSPIYDSTKVLQPVGAYGNDNKNGAFRGSLVIPKDTLKLGAKDSGAIASKNNSLFQYNGYKWIAAGAGGGGGGSAIFAGGVISSLPAIGNNPGTNITSNDFIISQFYASQAPTATLTGGGTFEYRSAGSGPSTLFWGAGRQSATAPLATIIVDGVAQTFSQPAQAATVSGTKAITITYNTNTTFTNTVTTADGKTAIATTSYLWQNKIYAGFVSSATPSDLDIYTSTGSSYVGGIFSGTINQSGVLTAPSSSKYFVFVAPASYGTPNITVNGLGVSFTLITRSFTNASGFTSSYTIAISPNPTAGQIDSYIVN